MNFLKKTGLIAALFLHTILAYTQTINHFAIEPREIYPGQTITINYNPSGTALENKGPVKMSLLTYTNRKWKFSELSLQKKDSLWITRYTIPGNTALISAKFRSGNLVDDGGRSTYSWLVMEPGKGEMPGAKIAWAQLRNNTLPDYHPKFVSPEALIGDSVVIYWYNQELRFHPESRRFIFYPAIQLLNINQKERAIAAARREIPFLLGLPDVTEEEMLQAADVLQNVLMETQRTDSLNKVILAKYPKGILARDKELFRLFRESDFAKREVGFIQFMRDFPIDKFKDVNTGADNLYYAKLIRSVVYPHVVNKDFKLFTELLPISPFANLADFEYHAIQLPLQQKYYTPEFLLPYSTMIIDRLDAARKDPTIKEAALYEPAVWDSLVLMQSTDTYKTHVDVLQQCKKYKEALKYALMIRDLYRYKNSEFNQTYIELLKANNRREEILPYVLKCAKENALTPEMIAVIQADYQEKNKTAEGFEAYLSSLKAGVSTEQKKHLSSELINLPIESFSLESNKGGTVTLDAQKGKIVVLDFWATWCAPCKAAMPGMQMAQNKYKNDPNVQFYFISTLETSPDYRKQIQKFLAEKKYDFNVLYDKSGKTGKHLDDTYARYSKAFGFSGIPHKMIIDANGRLRWRSIGYTGSPSALADEISIIIEALKQEAENKQ